MSFAAVEQLKAQYTDKLVEVDPSIPELRRFKGLVGTVKTVNMNGRLLIQFDHPVDIGWYDIDPAYLRIVEGKAKPTAAAKPAEKVAESPPASASKGPPVAKSEPAKPVLSAAPRGAAVASGAKPLSKLEQARQQGAAGKSATSPPAASAAAPAPAAAASAAGGRPLSKLEMARMQGAAGSAKGAPAAPAPAPSATPVPATPPAPVKAATPPSGGKPLSKLEQARQQGAFGSGAAATTPAAAQSAPAPASAPAPSPAPVATSAAKSIPKTGPDGKPLSKLELARLQGPFKG